MKGGKFVIIVLFFFLIVLFFLRYQIVSSVTVVPADYVPADFVTETKEIIDTPAPAPTPTPTPIPTPEPTPDLSPLDDEWFADAAFFGDSISVTLQRYCEQTGDLGDALFLCDFSYSVRNAITDEIPLWYQGRSYSSRDVLLDTGSKKAFFMLGVNDVALYGGVERTMECWEELIAGIREKTPHVMFFIESCFPVYRTSEFPGRNNDLIDAYNELLRQFCEDHNCVYVDIAKYFKDANNSLADEYCSDQYVHVTYDATKIWVEQLRNVENYSVNPRYIDYD